jgi:pimeloyl-ACP methyl ester carboxylesterase
MLRFFLRCATLAFAMLATGAQAESVVFAPGFTESRITDPETGLHVQMASGGKAGAPTVVLVHGLGQRASRDWLPVVQVLAEHYQVIVFDLPGFGRSGRVNTALSPKRQADFLHWLIKQHTNDPVIVVGHSLGAAIALRHSHDYPEQVARLLLIDAAGLLETTVFSRHLMRVDDNAGAPYGLQGLSSNGIRFINHVSGKFQDLMASRARALSAMVRSDTARGLLYRDSSSVNAALALVNEDFSPFVRGIRVPVWMLWGENDPVAPVRTGIALRWLLPQSQLQILTGVGHVPMSAATAETGAWLLKSMQEPLPAPGESTEELSQGDGICKNQKNQVFRGKWRSIRLERCTDARIENATMEQLVALDSSVTIENSSIHAQGTALEASKTNIEATGLRIVAPRAWSLDNSRLDLAAVHVSAADLGEEKNGSLLYLSLGHWCDGIDEWRLHDVWKTRKGALDKQFRKVRDGGCASVNSDI